MQWASLLPTKFSSINDNNINRKLHVASRIAKFFGNALYFGSVVNNFQGEWKLWHIKYDDDNKEDMLFSDFVEGCLFEDEKDGQD